MKEIIQHGNKNINIKYTNTCPMCGCTYSYSSEDAFIKYTGTSMVSCPECGSDNIAAVFPQTNEYPYINMEVDQEGNIWNKNIK